MENKEKYKPKPTRHTQTDVWDKKYPNGQMENWPVPRGENPICCPESKNPTPKPVDRFDPRSSKGTRICDPKDGGCGSEWTPIKPDAKKKPAW